MYPNSIDEQYHIPTIGEQLYKRQEELGLNDCQDEDDLERELERVFPGKFRQMSLAEMIDDMEHNVLPKLKSFSMSSEPIAELENSPIPPTKSQPSPLQ